MTPRRLRRPARTWALVLACAWAGTAPAAVPPGYQYVGSRTVSEGRVVYWYWNPAQGEVVGDGTAFVARLFARAVDVDLERPYVAVIRCDQRLYREYGSRGAYEAIDEGEPIAAVWRAGCRDGRAVVAAAPIAGSGAPPPPAGAPTPAPGAAPERAAPGEARRADPCVRVAETRPVPAGDATMTNTCAFPVEVSLCYRGTGTGALDCGAVARGRHSASLAPGATQVLPEYRRGRNQGVALVACKGTLGSVFPRLDEARGSGCF
ncbi:MAG: hypothetical protein U1F10_09770 [Burkholderiales bacterium]